MFTALRTWFRPIAAAAVLVVGFAGRADAGWVTIRNDTGKPVVVQESIHWNGDYRRVKPTRLLPGESCREFIPAAETRKVEIFDGSTPPVVLYTGSLPVRDEAQTFAVTTDGRTTRFAAVAVHAMAHHKPR